MGKKQGEPMLSPFDEFMTFEVGYGWATLLLRLACGLSLMTYAIVKIQSFHTEKGFPTVKPFTSRQSFLLAMTIESVASFCMIFGLFTRLACIPGFCNMAVAYKVNHGPGLSAPSLSYVLMFIAIFIAGPGPYSLDHLIYGL